MEGVEDIPGVVLTEGLSWNWESFPDFLKALEAQDHDIDFAAQLPPPCAFMSWGNRARGAGRRGADIQAMAQLTREAMAPVL